MDDRRQEMLFDRFKTTAFSVCLNGSDDSPSTFMQLNNGGDVAPMCDDNPVAPPSSAIGSSLIMTSKLHPAAVEKMDVLHVNPSYEFGDERTTPFSAFEGHQQRYLPENDRRHSLPIGGSHETTRRKSWLQRMTSLRRHWTPRSGRSSNLAFISAGWRHCRRRLDITFDGSVGDLRSESGIGNAGHWQYLKSPSTGAVAAGDTVTSSSYVCNEKGFPVSSWAGEESRIWVEAEDENRSEIVDNEDTESKMRLDQDLATVNHVPFAGCCKRQQDNGNDDVILEKPEAFGRILIEIVVPFLMAGFGCMFAGIVLDIVQHWQVFQEVSEIFILVPALLGLKGNLEMTLASRLSTQANLGHLDSTSELLKVIGGNLALIQVQAVVVGFLASLLAVLLGWIPKSKFDLLEGFMLCCSSVVTASIASVILASLMVGVVILSRRLHVNPDNVATPIGGALGDLTTLSLLSGIAVLLHRSLDGYGWLPPVILSFALCLTPIWWTFASRNKYAHDVLHNGWTPVIGAMTISSVGGLILDFAVETFSGLAVFQPVVNGVGGNLVAIQASRLATALHRVSVPKELPSGAVNGCPNVFSTFFGKTSSAKTARVLMLMVIPGHVIFMFAIQSLRHGGPSQTIITVRFAASYLTATVFQVSILLFIANWLVHWLWKRGHDPDNFSIPYLTAFGDLLGGMLLALTFFILHVIGDESIAGAAGPDVANATPVATVTAVFGSMVTIGPDLT